LRSVATTKHPDPLATSKEATDLLCGAHRRDWPRENVRRICKLAAVPEVTAHGMRDLHSTRAPAHGRPLSSERR